MRGRRRESEQRRKFSAKRHRPLNPSFSPHAGRRSRERRRRASHDEPFSRRVRARAVLTRPDYGQRQETNCSPKRRERSAGRRWVDSAPRSRRRRLLRFGRGIPPPHLSRGGGRCGGGRASRRSTAAPSFCSAPPLLPLSGSSRETPVAAQGFGHVVSAGAVVNRRVGLPSALSTATAERASLARVIKPCVRSIS